MQTDDQLGIKARGCVARAAASRPGCTGCMPAPTCAIPLRLAVAACATASDCCTALACCSISYLLALARGCWVVSHTYVAACLAAGCWLPEGDHEAQVSASRFFRPFNSQLNVLAGLLCTARD
jgi:hypothetical protein